MAFLNENGLHALRECCDALYLSKADASNIYLSKGDAEHLPYLPLSGGTMTGQINQKAYVKTDSYSYYNSKERCCLYRANPSPDSQHYFPVIGMESVNGGTLSVGAVAGDKDSEAGCVMSFVYNPKDNVTASNVRQIRMNIKQKGIEASSTSLASYNASTSTFTPRTVGSSESWVYFNKDGIPVKGKTIKAGTEAVGKITGMTVGDIYIKYE
jgi:hypothetical protein